MDRVGTGRASDPDEVRAELLFVDPLGAPPVVHFVRPSEVDMERTVGAFRHEPVIIRNGRRQQRQPSLDEEGFAFARHETRVGDFYDDAEIRRVYYPEMVELTRALTGAREVIVFDHTVRSNLAGRRGSVEVELPSDMMHCDLTGKAAAETLEQVAPGMDPARGRVLQINIWRPVSGPLATMPLTVCDGRSLKPEKCVHTELIRPDFSSEFITLAHDPEQRWSYLPNMERDEVIVLKNYDSDPAMSRYSIHGAFVDPAVPADAPPRESIEVRIFAQL